jgi:phytanoyl-CoA hydroxylase
MTDHDGTVFEQLDTTPLPTPPDDLVPLPVPAGSLVVLHGLLPHWSGANRSPRSRHAYSVHCISAAASYPAWNWLRRDVELPLRRLDTVSAS